MTPSQRKALLDEITHPILCAGPDDEIARDHGVTPREVRELRDAVERAMLCSDLLCDAREIARLTGTTLRVSTILRCAVRSVREALEGQAAESAPAGERRVA